MAAAIGLVVFQTQRIAFSHPDVTWSKSEREQTMRENDEAAEKHHEHWVRTRSRVGETQIMPGQSRQRSFFGMERRPKFPG
jgi:hypothetical protein